MSLRDGNNGNDPLVSPEQLLNGEKLESIDFLQIRYTDVPGRFLAKYLHLNYDADSLYDSLRGSVGVDGSSVKGFADIEESDLLLVPDRSTVRLTPISSNYRTATVIADVYKGYNSGRLTKDPRYVSQRLEEYLTENRMQCQLGSEVECFIFDSINFKHDGNILNPLVVSSEQYEHGKYPIRRKGGYDAPPFQDSLMEFRFEVAEILRRYYAIQVTNLNHEVASNGQIEINFMHNTLTRSADNVQTFKDVVRNIAKQYNKVATFMPKPIFGQGDPDIDSDNGSGMHTSISLWSGGSSTPSSSSSSSSSDRSSFKSGINIFYDRDDNYAELSQSGRYFIGGILEHAPSLAAIVAPTVNSYQRIIPGFEAPVYVAWSRGNRSAIVRVPVNEKNISKSKRIEFRAPDPSANPYLAFSSIVAAGLDGIKKKKDPGSSVDNDIYKMSEQDKASLRIKSLPGTLTEALEELKCDSEYLDLFFSTDLLETYSMLKKEEVKEVEGQGSSSSHPVSSRLKLFMRYYDV
jgi:glutamine synthetase